MDLIKIVKSQNEICEKFHSEYMEAPVNFKVGISRNIKHGIIPINGLRYPPEGDTTGWYIWGGEYSDSSDFFVPVHVKHLNEWSPLIIRYLGLSPGWRFLVTPEYEDVWFDKSLPAVR